MSPFSSPPAGVSFHKDASLLVWRPPGVITEGVVDEVVAYLDDLELRREKPFHRFIDTDQTEAIELNYRYIMTVSLYRRLAYKGPVIKSAILVTKEAMMRYFKIHALLTQGSKIKVRLFPKRVAVAKWLDVPSELLASKDEEG